MCTRILAEPKCYTRKCRHFDGVEGDEPDERVVCEAFPDGISDDIAYGDEQCDRYEKKE